MRFLTTTGYFGRLCLAAALTGVLAQAADANSRLKVRNNTDHKITVQVYDGNNGKCDSGPKNKTVGSGNYKAMGCAGEGKNRCKIRVIVKNETDACSKMNDTCAGNGLIVSNGRTVLVKEASDNTYSCAFEN